MSRLLLPLAVGIWLAGAPAARAEFDTDAFPALYDASDEAGATGYGAARGANVNDFDGDGSLDIYVSMVTAQGSADFFYNGANLLFLNDGTGHFVESAQAFGVGNLCEGRAPLFADFDNDGLGDLYLNINGYNQLFRGRPDGTLLEVTDQAGVGNRGYGHQSLWLDYDRDGFLDLFLTNGPRRGSTFNVLYRNNGDGTFSDVTEIAGVAGDVQCKGATVLDYDGDGWSDLFVTSGQDYPNWLYRNNGDGTFTNVAAAAGVSDVFRAFGIWAVSADYDNDGWMDLFVGNHDIYYVGLQVFHNNGDGTFTDRAVEAGIEDAYNGHGFAYGDLNNDGWLDTLFCYGDRACRVFAGTGEPVVDASGDPIPGAGTTFVEIPSRTYEDVEDEFQALPGETVINAWGIALGDVDEDGFLDAYVSAGQGQQPAHDLLFINEGGENRWLHVDVVGRRGSGSGIGAKVVLETPGGAEGCPATRQTRTVGEFGGNTSQGSLRVEFGLGTCSGASALSVEFPSGEVATVDSPGDLMADQVITVVEPGPDWMWDGDGDGVPDVTDRCPDTPYAHRTDAVGCGAEESQPATGYLALSAPADGAIATDPPTFEWLANLDGYRVQLSPGPDFSPEHRFEWGPLAGNSFTVPEGDWEALRAANTGDIWFWRVEGSGAAGQWRTAARHLNVPVWTDVVRMPSGVNLFWPGHIEVTAGTEVLWFNDDAAHGNYDELSHDIELVDEGGRVVRSHQLILEGSTMSFAFDDPGLFYYVCRTHSGPGHDTHEQSMPSGGYSNPGPYQCMAGSVTVRSPGGTP